ncbi:MAG: efflux RND transporter periplasmic adaptor subunit [Anaerolineae bacterium]|nr:efflux RND transporter periplasmic adaptor subunit [Anaerolineae bacterium]MCI0608814.1 efflux RND transporter periplasmic adaptor subunit [Anaerolineae bacterium]
MNRRVVIIFVLVGILVISGAGYFGFATTQEPEPTPTPQTVSVSICDVEQTVTAPGNLVNVNEAEVIMPVTGRLSAVNVRVGDEVQAGQILAELDPVTTSQAQLDLIEAQDELNKLEKRRTALDYPRATDDFIKDLRKQIKAAKESVDYLNDSYKNTDDPLAKSQILAGLTTAKSDLKTLESNLSWYMSKPSDKDVAQADSELALAQAKYDLAEAVLQSLQIKAPFDGIVFEVSAHAGQTYQAEAALFTIGDPKALEVKANITEEDYPIVSVGQAVEVFFDARPEVTVTGKVERIIPKRIEGDRPLYNIYISLKEIPDGLADGMTSDTAITIAKREGVLCLPRAAVRASSGDTTTVKVWNGVEELTKEITIGLRGDTYVEIVSGLSEGEQVVTR